MTMEINKITGEKTRHSTSNTSKPSPEKVYPYEPKPASYPLTFVNYGTFTGKADMDYTYEDNYVENEDSEGKLAPWFDLIPTESSGLNTPHNGVALVTTKDNYTVFRGTGSDVSNITLERGGGGILTSLKVKSLGSVNTGVLTVNAPTFMATGGHPLWVGGNAYFNGGGIGDLSARFSAADGKPKPFDIKHPTKGDGHRLRYACIEGPEVGVYFRGRLSNGNNVIELPYYWKDLVYTDSLSVHLTPYQSYQELFVDKIEWGQKIIIKNGACGPIDCFYSVYGERKDINPLITEYEGDSWKDYPDPNFNPGKVDDVDNPNFKDPRYEGPRNTQIL